MDLEIEGKTRRNQPDEPGSPNRRMPDDVILVIETGLNDAIAGPQKGLLLTVGQFNRECGPKWDAFWLYTLRRFNNIIFIGPGDHTR